MPEPVIAMGRTGPVAGADIRERMERMYRPQTLVYDLTRKYYLIGRDALIAGLGARPGQRILDLGCGTGRNLVAIARAWPGTMAYGLDASAAMLEVAARKVDRAGLEARICFARADAETADLPGLFGIEDGVDHVTISYALSMMDAPLAAIDQAIGYLHPGGCLHVVDFGDMAGLPGPVRRGLRAWLHRFGVHHRPEVAPRLASLAEASGAQLSHRRLLGGYAELSVFRSSARDC